MILIKEVSGSGEQLPFSLSMCVNRQSSSTTDETEALSAKFDGSTSLGTVSVDSSVSPPWLSEKSSR